MSHVLFLGLSITSSWGNGHATGYRALARALARRGHEVTFLERDQPWYAANRDLPEPPYCRTELYESLEELRDRFSMLIRDADLVVVGSYVPQGDAVGEVVLELGRGMSAFYDIDTPVTLQRLEGGTCGYLQPDQIARYDVYLSFTGGPILRYLEDHFGSRQAIEFPCFADPGAHHPQEGKPRVDLGYLGTYSEGRQARIRELLLLPAARWPEGRFEIAGPGFPDRAAWPGNVDYREHVPPDQHGSFYCPQRFTLNVTRRAMRRWGYSPSVRMFEAAASGVPVVTDRWAGIERYFEPGREILLVTTADDVLAVLQGTSERERTAIAQRARARVLREHTAEHRAALLECFLQRQARSRWRQFVAARTHDEAS